MSVTPYRKLLDSIPPHQSMEEVLENEKQRIKNKIKTHQKIYRYVQCICFPVALVNDATAYCLGLEDWQKWQYIKIIPREGRCYPTITCCIPQKEFSRHALNREDWNTLKMIYAGNQLKPYFNGIGQNQDLLKLTLSYLPPNIDDFREPDESA